MTEAEIIQGCINNSRLAQRELFDIYHREMTTLCMMYCNNREDARWVANQGFLDVFENIGSFMQKSSLKTWIKRLMINRAIQFYRKAHQYTQNIALVDAEDLANMEQGLSLPGISVIEKMQADDIIRLVETLPFFERTVFLMHVTEGFSHKEIGEMLGFADGTSRWYLNVAKTVLKQKLSTHKPALVL